MQTSIADELRRSALASGKSGNELAKLSRVPQSSISRFLNGRGLSIEHAARLAATLRLRLVATN